MHRLSKSDKTGNIFPIFVKNTAAYTLFGHNGEDFRRFLRGQRFLGIKLKVCLMGICRIGFVKTKGWVEAIVPFITQRSWRLSL